jgi:hypothetical protein
MMSQRTSGRAHQRIEYSPEKQLAEQQHLRGRRQDQKHALFFVL